MKKFLVIFCGLVLIHINANAMNAMADAVRNCERLYVGTSDNYVLMCDKSEKIDNIMSDDNNISQFFASDNDGDERGTFLSYIPDDIEHIYVNVASNLRDMRYENQTCYRFITEKDTQRDGFYAVEVCEYERPDYYL